MRGVRWRDVRSRQEKRQIGNGEQITKELTSKLGRDEIVEEALTKGGGQEPWHEVTRNTDLFIRTDDKSGGWVLSHSSMYLGVGREQDSFLAKYVLPDTGGPTRMQWDCYQTIARYLLAMPIPTEN